jgi:hypothetical protein
MEYDPGINRNSGVFNLWLDATCNLQRLDTTGFPVEVDLEYITPYYQQRPTAALEQHLHRLQHAMIDTHMGFLRNWLPQSKASYTTGDQITYDCMSNDALSYFTTRRLTRHYEHLVLHLKQLSRKKPISRDISEFRKLLQRWKHYNDDRIFAGDYAPSIPS